MDGWMYVMMMTIACIIKQNPFKFPLFLSVDISHGIIMPQVRNGDDFPITAPTMHSERNKVKR